MELFTRHGVYTRIEMESREEALLEEYYKTLRIEALTMIDMVREEILPACISFQHDLAETVLRKKEAGIAGGMESGLLSEVSDKTETLYRNNEALEQVLNHTPVGKVQEIVNYYHDVILPAMDAVRAPADQLETLVGKKYWPFPTYSDILFYV